MNFKPHPYKLANLVVFYVLFIGVIISISYKNDLEQSQSELFKFYQANLTNCEITDIMEKPYSGGRGSYKLFTTTCSNEYYPISLNPYDIESIVELFTNGVLISKEPNSTLLTLLANNNTHTIEIRHFETEDNRPFSLKVVGAFLIIVTIIILIIPNSKYEQIRP